MGIGRHCGEPDDVGEVEAEWESSGISRGVEGYVRIKGLGMTGVPLDKDTWEEKAGI